MAAKAKRKRVIRNPVFEDLEPETYGAIDKDRRRMLLVFGLLEVGTEFAISTLHRLREFLAAFRKCGTK